MKTLIFGLLSLTILGACANGFKAEPMTGPPLPPAGQGFCNANDGIFVIWVNDMGEKNAFVCPKIKGKTIFQEDKVRDGLEKKKDTELGEVEKFGPSGTNPDPCIHWNAGGKQYYFCWD